MESPTCGLAPPPPPPTAGPLPTAVCNDVTVNLAGCMGSIDSLIVAGGSMSNCPDGSAPTIAISLTEFTAADLTGCSTAIGVLVAVSNDCSSRTDFCIAEITVVNQAPALDCVTTTVSLDCLLYTSPSPRDATLSRMPSSA